MQRISMKAAIAAAIVGLAVAAPAEAKELVLYTASNAKIEKDVVAAFQAAHPEI